MRCSSPRRPGDWSKISSCSRPPGRLNSEDARNRSTRSASSACETQSRDPASCPRRRCWAGAPRHSYCANAGRAAKRASARRCCCAGKRVSASQVWSGRCVSRSPRRPAPASRFAARPTSPTAPCTRSSPTCISSSASRARTAPRRGSRGSSARCRTTRSPTRGRSHCLPRSCRYRFPRIGIPRLS